MRPYGSSRHATIVVEDPPKLMPYLKVRTHLSASSLWPSAVSIYTSKYTQRTILRIRFTLKHILCVIGTLLFMNTLYVYRISEAEKVLTGDDMGKGQSVDEIIKEFGDIAAFALMLVASICFTTERLTRGIEAARRVILRFRVLNSYYSYLEIHSTN